MLISPEISSHFLVTFVYFLLVSVLRWQFDWGLIGLWLGAILGTFFLDIDHLVYWFVTKPFQPDSIQAKEIWKTKGFKGLKELKTLLEQFHATHTRLVFHSVIGQAVLLLLGFYLITSGGSIFGAGFILSLNLYLLKDEWQDYLANKKDHLSDWLFWQVRGINPAKNLSAYLLIVSILFLGLTLFFA
jgi:hypothetical protein